MTSRRTTVEIEGTPQIIGIGDSTNKKESVFLSSSSALFQLHSLGLVRLFPLLFRIPSLTIDLLQS